MGKETFGIQWIGNQRFDSSMGQVNWQICEELTKLGHRVVSTESNQVREGIDFVIHHDLSSNFSDLPLAAHPRTIAFRTWDFGPFPPKWVERINNEYARLWVYSEWTNIQAQQSGIKKEKVNTISLGFDPGIYNTEAGQPFQLNTEKRFRFLFVGAAVQRKGVDILLAAYRLAFSDREDVCLVIKGFLGGPFYRNTYEQNAINEFLAKKDNPEVVYLKDFYSPAELAGLIRSCNFGVFPYRAEGFALPVLELMACARPCLVPRFGPCLDYCSDANAMFVDHLEIQLPIEKKFTYNSLGFEEWINAVHFCEVKVEDLARKMRNAFDMDVKSYRVISSNAAKSAQRFTWSNTAKVIEKTLEQLR